MKIIKKLTLVLLSLVLLFNLCACSNTKTTYTTKKETVLVPTTKTETRVVGQRIIGERKVYIDDNENGIIDDFESDNDDISSDDSSTGDNSSNNSSSDEVVEENIPPMTDNFIEGDTFNYRVIRSADSPAIVTTIARDFVNEIKEKLNCDVTFKTDAVNAHKEQRELIIGASNRPASAYAEKILRANRANCYYDAIVITVGNDICIFGYEKEALLKAVEHFIVTFCDGNTKKAPTNYQWIYEGNSAHTLYPTLKTLSIGGKDISNFRIVIASSPNKFALGSAEYLQQTIETATGFPIDIAYDSVTAQENEIHIGATKSNTSAPSDSSKYNVKLANGKLNFSSKDYELVNMLIRDFADKIKNSASGYSVPAGYDTTGDYYDMQIGFGNDYKLVWYDEFNKSDGNTINSSRWTPLEKTVYTDSGSKEKYVPETMEISDNNTLLMKATRYSERVYNASEMTTENSAWFMYGYFEIKIKFAGGSGVSSVFWLNSSLSYNNRPEIDIYEQFGNQKVLISNLHSWNVGSDKKHIDHGATEDSGDHPFNRKFIPDGTELIASDEYRIIACEWTPYTITMYADGAPFCVWDIRDGNYDSFRNHPAMMMLECYSGNNSSQIIGPDGDLASEIDYIRVYQRDNSKSGYTSFASKTGNKSSISDVTMALPPKN